MIEKLSQAELERFGVPLPPGTLAWGLRRDQVFTGILTACPLGAGDWGSEGFAGHDPTAKEALALVEAVGAGLASLGGRVWLSFGTLPGFKAAGTLMTMESNPQGGGGARPARGDGEGALRCAPTEIRDETAFANLVRECQKGSLDFPEIPPVPEPLTLEPYKGQGTALWRRFTISSPDGREEEVGALVLSAIDERTAHLNFFGLKPSWRGRGFGEALLHEALALSGRRTLTAAVDARNAPARSLYKKLGFTQTGTKAVMWRDLRTPTPPPF